MYGICSLINIFGLLKIKKTFCLIVCGLLLIQLPSTDNENAVNDEFGGKFCSESKAQVIYVVIYILWLSLTVPSK